MSENEVEQDPATSRASELIERLDLQPHPEGGSFREIFRSARRVHTAHGGPERAALTEIYFLLVAGGHSRWHRIWSDEVWHYYEGAPLELFWISEDKAQYERCLMGEIADMTRPVCVVPGGCWQAARAMGEYTLAGCTVGPGFEYDEFRLLSESPGEANEIRERFPELAMLI